MVDPDDGQAPEARPPAADDLIGLCRRLNQEGARYIVIGGMAIIQAGFVRATEDIDLLIEATADNVARVRRALMALPDQAVQEMADADLDDYVVVRVADEFVVDLMKTACGIDYADASRTIEWAELGDVRIPFASADLLWRTKQTPREKDRLDRVFLAQLLGRQQIP